MPETAATPVPEAEDAQGELNWQYPPGWVDYSDLPDKETLGDEEQPGLSNWRYLLVNAPIGRHPVDRKRMAVTEKNSRHAVTHWEVIERYAGFTHIRCKLETGRTHQIRVHMAHIGHPLLGDMVYGAGKPEKGLEGQCLHARTLKFIHPRTGEHMELTSPLPEYFTAVLARLGPPLDNK